ncbi:MAG: hypothetical protein EOO68_22945 [Moraxellaceae bacterium]|nr:MAG: hypothetical protein EOO68_22945 [Moraxellaceae bacterium]
MFHIVLYEPQIAPNTGNIIRLAANNGCTLHLIEPLGFDIQEKNLRRAGLDYAELADVHFHANYHEFLKSVEGRRIFACTTKGSRPCVQTFWKNFERRVRHPWSADADVTSLHSILDDPNVTNCCV